MFPRGKLKFQYLANGKFETLFARQQARARDFLSFAKAIESSRRRERWNLAKRLRDTYLFEEHSSALCVTKWLWTHAEYRLLLGRRGREIFCKTEQDNCFIFQPSLLSFLHKMWKAAIILPDRRVNVCFVRTTWLYCEHYALPYLDRWYSVGW